MSAMCRTRLLVAATVVAIAMLASGCIVFTGTTVGQIQAIGDVQVAFSACASGSAGCTSLGFSGAKAQPGTGQILVGALVPTTVALPATFTSAGPEALVFSESPTYTAELQRLAPADSGFRWAGYLSAVTNYAAESGPQALSASLFLRLGQGADGSPFAGPLVSDLLIGGRQVTADFPGSRPVTCGDSLSVLSDDDPTKNFAKVICKDDAFDFSVPTHDLGILAGATGIGRPGTLASLPFTLRSAGLLSKTLFNLTATSTLTGAGEAVTPGSLVPGVDATSQAVVAVGIPADARAGTYDVTLTARLVNGQTRRGVGRLTVLAGGTGGGGGGGTTGGGATARLKLTTVLPRGLSVVTARRSGIAVLIGATTTGTARVQLFQGTGRKGRKPKASKGVRLRVPGPTRVVLKSKKLQKGAYRVVIRADGRNFVKSGTLTK
jgi:hypothetical protein